ncbi:ROK family protein [Celerinatantimonas yamalensis]|uniref:N-acetylglucosamine kinase n=1 Tax=Celerinatantimonas yamalensis TaxID=559956 RepID=A0ABW9G7I0_9GAMM
MQLQPVICADIGGSFIKFGVSTAFGQVQFLEQRPNPATDWQALCHTLAELITCHRSQYPDDAPVAISTTGVVDRQQDRVTAGNISAYQGHRIQYELSQCLGRVVRVANDADCFTLAEALVGHAREQPIVLGAIIGTGIGGGLVINGQIIEGRNGITAEWGHAPITRTVITINHQPITIARQPCGCGQTGCLDTLAGARGLERLHQLLHHQTLDSRAIIKHWHAGQLQASQTIDGWLQIISEPLAYTLNILGASRVVVGGGLAEETALIRQLDRAVRLLTLTGTEQPLIVPGKFYQDGGLIGASLLVRQ